MSQQHVLKTIDRYFDAVLDGEKTFEVRKNDRAFQKGDELVLERWEPTQFGELRRSVPFQSLTTKITYLLQGGQFGIEPQYCVLGFKKGDGQMTGDRQARAWKRRNER